MRNKLYAGVPKWFKGAVLKTVRSGNRRLGSNPSPCASKESTMEKPRINIDKQIDEGKCPGLFWCTVATTCYPEWEREHKCYRCWKEYCKENEIEIDYGDII